MEDKKLLEGILGGNDLAFSLLVRKYQKMVFATIFHIVHNRPDAEDIFQDVFLEVYRSIQHLRKEENLAGWLFKIAFNKSISHLRRKNPVKMGLKGMVSSESELEYRSDDNNPFKIIEKREVIQTLFAAIDMLPPNQKKAFLMHKFHNFSHREIAEDMHTSIASVESLIQRAKCKLKKVLYAYYLQSKS